jgi:hypothetical protein
MDTKTVTADKNRSTVGLLLLAGVTAAALIAGTSVSRAQVHTHCTTTGCEELGCSEHHPGFECKVTDDDVCNCVDPPIEG